VKEQVGEFTRILAFEPGYDKRDDGYGVYGMNLRFVLKGELGAVQFLLYTDFDVSSLREGITGRSSRAVGPMPAGLGYHALKPLRDGQCASDCEYVEGGKCYYDGSGLNAEDPFDILTDDGEPALWKFLEQYYRATFERAGYPPELGRRWKQHSQVASQ
jgi:hypothetical protein